jgi:hypothetical protein
VKKPRNKGSLVGFLVVLCLMLTRVSLDSAELPPAVAVLVQGDVFIRQGDSLWQEIIVGRKLAYGDELWVTNESQLELVFPEGVSVLVQGKARLEIPKEGELPLEGQNNRASLRVKVGRVWVHVLEKVVGVRSFSIETPTAVAGVRGTVFSLEVNHREDTILDVHQGLVQLDDGRKSALVGAGCRSRVTKEGLTEGIEVPRYLMSMRMPLGGAPIRGEIIW